MQNIIYKLEQYYPCRWESANYGNKLHVLFPVDKLSEEYREVKGNFSYPVKHVDRIQHPLAYLRYVLHGEYLSLKENLSPREMEERIVYHVVDKNDLLDALNSNCDIRHYKRVTKHVLIVDQKNIPVSNEYAVIVVKRRGNVGQYSFTKNHYPMYVVEFDFVGH